MATIIGGTLPKGNEPILQHSVAYLNIVDGLPWLTEGEAGQSTSRVVEQRIAAEGKNIAKMPEIAAANMIRPVKNTFLLLVHFLFTLFGKLVLSFLLFISS